MSANKGAKIESIIQDDMDVRPAPPSLELASKDGLASRSSRAPTLTLRKKRHAVEHAEDYSPPNDNNNNKFAMTCYNSAFLQGLFEDIADDDNTTSRSIVPADSDEAEEPAKETLKEQKVVEADAAVPVDGNDSATAAEVTTVAAISEYNLAKRRRVSTTRSLERCGPSHNKNLASFSPLSSHGNGCPTKGSSHSFLPTMTTKTTSTTRLLELPATVSASYSFQEDLAAETTKASSKNINDDKTNSIIHAPHPEEEDFGWYIETDGYDGEHDPSCDPDAQRTHPTAAPLAFSAAVAPRAPTTQDHRAAVEWAAAADMVDDVLGDFF